MTINFLIVIYELDEGIILELYVAIPKADTGDLQLVSGGAYLPYP